MNIMFIYLIITKVTMNTNRIAKHKKTRTKKRTLSNLCSSATYIKKQCFIKLQSSLLSNRDWFHPSPQ